jgi:acyl-CoA synthetase (NDP forming)
LKIMAWNADLETAFYPKVVAVVGVASTARREDPWVTGGASFIRAYEQLGFPGRIYIVNPGATEILGYKAYPSVSAIPEPADLVIIAVPAKFAPDILENCIVANVKNIHMLTSGFEEIEDEQAKDLGRRVREIALRGGLRIIGPNCMGLYVPAAGIGFFDRLPKKSGPVSFISQSGGHCNWFTHNAPNYGIYFSKVISFGNAYILDSTDFLDYLAVDPETKVICIYLEGVKDGGKLLRQVQKINRVKPIIFWKAGLTASGSRAAASHTASLAGQEAIWGGFFAQTGAVPVNSLEEMAETTMSFLYVKPPRGKRVAVIGSGGGTSVAAADVCSNDGLDVPPLSQSTQNELKKFIPLAGNSLKNPLDTTLAFRDISLLIHEVEAVAADPAIDMLIIMPHLDMAFRIGADRVDKMISYLSDFAKNNPFEKPAVIVFHSFANDSTESELRSKLRVELTNKGIAVYSTLAGASRALAKLHEYSRIQNSLGT